MGPLEIVGTITCLWALAFVIGFGLAMGVWAGVHAGSWAFGAWKVNTTNHIITGGSK